MSVGKFSILDIATIKVSANGKTQTIDLSGTKNLKGTINEKSQNNKKDRESKPDLRVLSGGKSFGTKIGVE
jgi:hypothetical protein